MVRSLFPAIIWERVKAWKKRELEIGMHFSSTLQITVIIQIYYTVINLSTNGDIYLQVLKRAKVVAPWY